MLRENLLCQLSVPLAYKMKDCLNRPEEVYVTWVEGKLERNLAVFSHLTPPPVLWTHLDTLPKMQTCIMYQHRNESTLGNKQLVIPACATVCWQITWMRNRLAWTESPEALLPQRDSAWLHKGLSVPCMITPSEFRTDQWCSASRPEWLN